MMLSDDMLVPMMQMLLVVALVLIVGVLALKLALSFAQTMTQRTFSMKALLVGLKPKLWMTAGLGVGFGFFYLCFIYLLSYFLSDDLKQQFFTSAWSHPTYFIYGGLCIFALTSVAILGVREVIKRIYNSRNGP